MFTVGIGTFMSTLDASIVNVSLPTIMNALHTNLAVVQWVVSIYLLVVTGLLLSLGRLADLVGRKPIYIAGFVVFTLGSVLCGLSRHACLLIAFRGLQAVGAAMIMANGPAIITHVFPGTERGKAMGMIGMVVATGLMVGPALGGMLIASSGWPLIFFINLPIGIFGIWTAQTILRREERKRERQDFDIPGAILLLVSLLSLTLALSQGPGTGWKSPLIIGLFAGFAVSGIGFVMRERAFPHPVIDLGLFRNRLFAAASVSAFINYVANFAVMFLMPFYLTAVLRYAPERMGLTLTAVPITVAIVAPLSGALSDKIGSRILGSIGLGIASIGLLLIGGLGASPAHLHVICALAVVGFGTAVFQSPNSSAIMGCVPPTMLGVASGTLATMRNLGMITGVALTSAVYSSRLNSYSLTFSTRMATVHAFRDAFIIAAAICALGILTSAARGPEQQHRQLAG